MKSGPIRLLQRLAGWRLSALFTLFTVIGALLIVSAMDLLLMGCLLYTSDAADE